MFFNRITPVFTTCLFFGIASHVSSFASDHENLADEIIAACKPDVYKPIPWAGNSRQELADELDKRLISKFWKGGKPSAFMNASSEISHPDSTLLGTVGFYIVDSLNKFHAWYEDRVKRIDAVCKFLAKQ